MLKKIAVAALLTTSFAFGEATTQPAPSTAPSAAPSTQPSAAKKKFPTPAELARQMLDKRDNEKKMLQVAYFDLTSGFSEKPADFSIFGGGASTTMRELIERLTKARDDKEVKAVLLYAGAGTGLNLAQAQEIRDTLVDLRKAGKKAFVYADTFDTTSYVLASGATNICLMQGGEIFIPGVGFETMFYKGALDKLGVHADYVQIGEYKGAEEPFTRSKPSDELQGEMNKLVDQFYKQLVDSIALNRNLKTETVKQVIDNAMITAKQAKETGWVDHLIDADGLRQLIKDEMGQEIRLVQNYGAPERQQLDFTNPFAILQLLNQREQVSDKPKVAVIYAEGTIVDGNGGSGLMGGQSIGSEEMRRALRMALRDDSVKAVVIRIDSPGGSALASEAMWQAARRVAEKKPLIISVGSMAASGGYYLASSGEWIVADPSAIVGSIGVVGGKFVMTDLYEKLGITTMNFQRGQNAGLYSSNERFDDRQRRMVSTWMKNTYDQFTERVMTTRSKKIKDIDLIARGRIFLAADAKELGMVDEIGGLKTAITTAAGKSNMKEGQYDVTVLPPPTTLADMISGREGAEAMTPVRAPSVKLEIKADSILNMMPANLRSSLGQQLQLMQILENRPVALMSPWVLTTK